METKTPEGSFCTLPQREGKLRRDASDGWGDGAGARIYGREGCPHTARARRNLPAARFIDVQADPAALREMLALTGGVRRIPVIARGEEVKIGFRRGS